MDEGIYDAAALRIMRAERVTTQARREFIAALLEFVEPGEPLDYLIGRFDTACASMMEAQAEALKGTMRDIGVDLRAQLHAAKERAEADR